MTPCAVLRRYEQLALYASALEAQQHPGSSPGGWPGSGGQLPGPGADWGVADGCSSCQESSDDEGVAGSEGGPWEDGGAGRRARMGLAEVLQSFCASARLGPDYQLADMENMVGDPPAGVGGGVEGWQWGWGVLAVLGSWGPCVAE
jgi:hypothetical protein